MTNQPIPTGAPDTSSNTEPSLRSLLQRVATRLPDASSTPAPPLPDCPVCVESGKTFDLTHAAPACAYCHDAGWVQRRARPQGQESFRTRSERCPRCSGTDRLEEAWADSGIDDQSRWRCMLSTFSLSRNPGMSVALEAATAWGEGTAPPFLLLLGDVGVGKTHLAIGALHARIARGEGVLYVVAAEWMDQLRQTQRTPRDDEESPRALPAVRGRAATVDVLVLDDLGAQRNTDFAAEQLLIVVNHRWERSLPTLITTNEDPTTFPPRTASRLLDRRSSRVVLCTGNDQRLAMPE